MTDRYLLICRACVGALLLLLLAGCAGMHPFSSWPQEANRWKQQLRQGNSSKVLTSIKQKQGERNQLLYTLEAGRIAQLSGDNQASKAWFAKAEQLYQQQDAAARIQGSALVENAAALATSDRFISYQSAPYERIFAQTFQALNYLALGDMTGAAVEFRRVDHTQRRQVLAHQEAIAEAEEEVQGDGVDTSKYEGYFQGLNAAAALVRSGIENAYSYYLSAAFWEGRGQYNDALVDYKKALQLLPQMDFIKEDVARVSRKLNGRVDTGKGLLVVAVEQGFVAPKQPVSIPIPTIHGTLAISFPVYQLHRLTKPLPLRLRVADQWLTTQPLARVGAIAAHALKEKVPAMLTRQILRATTKYALQKKANRSFGALGAFATQLYNLISERADLRSWLTLPANTQVARVQMPVGRYTLELSPLSGNTSLKVPVLPGSVTLVRVMQTGGQPIIQVMPITSTQGGRP